MTRSNKQLPLAAQMLLSAAVVAGAASVSLAQFPAGGGFQIGGGAGRGGTGGGGGGVRTTPVNASSDARTNTVVISGPTDQLKQIEEIIKQIDSNPAIDNVVHVYKLKNGSALNVEAVANLLFNGTGGNNRGQITGQTLGAGRVSTSTAGGRTGGGAARGGGGGAVAGGGVAAGGARGGATATFGGTTTGGAAGSAAGLTGQVSVIADPNTNTLLVSTNPKNWDRVKLILDELDRSVPQVLIKVLVAEVTHDNSTDLGADLTYGRQRLDGAGSLTEGFQSGTRFGVPGLDTGRGGIFQISESNFNATIRALETTGKLDVLSRPYILASDNQLASIKVGQSFPYIANSSINGTTGGVTNSVLYADIGILLDVIPHINPDGMVILDVAPEVSTVSDTRIQISTDVQATAFPTRSVVTRVAVENGQTVVIGGLMQDQKTSTINKVPLIGDIPFLGELFKRRVETKSKTELLIFLTPHVALRPSLLEGMAKEELDSTKLVPNSVAPGIFDEHMEGLKVGAPAPSTQPRVIDEPRELTPDQVPPQFQGRGPRGGGPGGPGGRGGRGGGGGGGQGGPGFPPPIPSANQ